MSDLCLDFEVYEPKLWDAVLRQFLKLRMLDDLQRVLLATAGVPELWCLPCLEKAWSLVVEACVAKVTSGGSQREKAIDQALRLLSQSPFALRAPVDALIQVAGKSSDGALSMIVSVLKGQVY